MLWRRAQHLFHSVGQLCLARGNVGAALEYADECLSSAETTGSVKTIVKTRRLRGRALRARSELSLAEAELESALETARQLGNPPQLCKTLVPVGDRWLEQGCLAEARTPKRSRSSMP